MKASMNFAGSETIRCTSMKSRVCGLKLATMAGPMLRLGTKCPSITSTWTRGRPGALGRRDFFAKLAKIGSQDRRGNVDHVPTPADSSDG